MNSSFESPRIRFNVGKGTYSCAPEQIVRLEACSNYTNIYFTDRKPVMQAKVLRAFQAILEPFGFLRIHRSHLINTKHIVRVDDEGIVHMKDAGPAEISRRKKTRVLKSLAIA